MPARSAKLILHAMLTVTLLAMGPGAAWASDHCDSAASEQRSEITSEATADCHEQEAMDAEAQHDKPTEDCCGCDFLCAAPGMMNVAASDLRHIQKPQPAVRVILRSPSSGFDEPPFRPPIIG